MTYFVRPTILVLLAFFLSASSFKEGMDHGRYAKKLEGKLLQVVAGDKDELSGYQQFLREMDYDPTIKTFVDRNGQPQYLKLLQVNEVEFYYTTTKKRHRFLRSMTKLESVLQESADLDDAALAALSGAPPPPPLPKTMTEEHRPAPPPAPQAPPAETKP
ncbi:MAG: hypothetical protein A2284_10950 [Deltaproteobacteria bacterium RIFOXYA12_FULL_61_11]|nr:MAG: hypothetical protein A2284_10950 [Deltaproteobacteria bacterium RIFOXYA12_FULL_61_11]